MSKNYFFRAWFYFRTGWSTYFAFIFAAINTLTVTYYLAIEKYPILHSIFPSFITYVLIIASISIPILILIGYVHYKRSSAFKAEADVYIEANPHMRRILSNTEMLLKLFDEITISTVKLSEGKKLNDDEINKLINVKKELSKYIKDSTISPKNYDDDKKEN